LYNDVLMAKFARLHYYELATAVESRPNLSRALTSVCVIVFSSSVMTNSHHCYKLEHIAAAEAAVATGPLTGRGFAPWAGREVIKRHKEKRC